MTPPSQAEARRQVRRQTGLVEGLPYDQPTKVSRFAGWVALFNDKFPKPEQQLRDRLNGQATPTFVSLSRTLHRALDDITGGYPDRANKNLFDLWAGALTAAVHTVSVVASSPLAKEHLAIHQRSREVAVSMQPVLTTLIMEHQDRLGDIKIGLSGPESFGVYEINPEALEIMTNGKIRFKSGLLDSLPIANERKLLPDDAFGYSTFIPNHGEEVVGDIEVRSAHIGCPISFINGFGESLLTVTADIATQNGLID